MFVPKVPRREDFCGSPPCPLCFDWVDDLPYVEPVEFVCVTVEETVQAEPVPVDGLEKMAQDLLGRAPTEAERKVLKEAGERIHQGNIRRKIERDQLIAKQDEEERDRRWINRIEHKIKEVVRDREIQAAKPVENYVTIDDMDPEKVKELCGAVAPVDQELVNLERSKVAKAKEDALNRELEYAAMQKFWAYDDKKKR